MREGPFLDKEDPTNQYILVDNEISGANLLFDTAAHDSFTNRELTRMYLEGVCQKYVIMRIEYTNHQRKRKMIKYIGFHRNKEYLGQPDNGHVRMIEIEKEKVAELLRNPVSEVTGNITRHSIIKKTRRGKCT